MRILYISGLVSPDRLAELQKMQTSNPGYAMQKFNRLVAEGFAKNGAEVSTLSAVPASSAIKKKFFGWHSDSYKSVVYRYIPFINITGLRQLCLFVYTFFYVLLWGLTDRKNKTVVCDMLAISINLATVLALKINRVQSVGILTDMPGLMVDQESSKNSTGTVRKIIGKIGRSYLSSFSKYVFLTEPMNVVMNGKVKPYIVMEGLVDIDTDNSESANKVSNRRIVYAGGLHERYGVNMLVEAFAKLPFQDVTLDLFGSGPSVEWIKNMSEQDSRIKYHGVKPNNEVVEFEKESLLLVNPRPTHEEFTKYSFPSKNMEYMATGTSVLTTRLPGMPKEYYPYVFLFDNETVDDFSNTLNNILILDAESLINKGQSAKGWVLKEKNNKEQANRILNLIYL